MSKLLLSMFCVVLLVGMSCKPEERKLPIYGQRELEMREVDGQMVEDTIYPTISDFHFTNQDGEDISQANFRGKVYVADFFLYFLPYHLSQDEGTAVAGL